MSETYGNPIKGFKIDNTIHKVDYESLTNKPMGVKQEIVIFPLKTLPFAEDGGK